MPNHHVIPATWVIGFYKFWSVTSPQFRDRSRKVCAVRSRQIAADLSPQAASSTVRTLLAGNWLQTKLPELSLFPFHCGQQRQPSPPPAIRLVRPPLATWRTVCNGSAYYLHRQMHSFIYCRWAAVVLVSSLRVKLATYTRLKTAVATVVKWLIIAFYTLTFFKLSRPQNLHLVPSDAAEAFFVI